MGPLRGRAYRDHLGFGSPRSDGHGAIISQGTADLLQEAARRLGLGEQDFLRLRYGWFDALANRVEVVWRNEVTYHVLALRQELPFRRSVQGWRERRWVDLAKIRQLAKDRPQGPTAWLLSRGLEEAMARATGFSGTLCSPGSS